MRKVIISIGLVFLSVVLFAQTRTLNKSLPAGYTESSYGVSPSGAAMYEIPLYIPPGSAGMEPSASISYNSLSGIGIFGMGWDLSGLSAIERSGETYFYDSDNTDVTYTNNDIFIIDGIRMVLTSGTYGADGAIYAQENENFSKIISHGTAGNGPQWFEVKTKEGLILQYGYTTDSRIEGVATGTTNPNGTVRKWYLNKIIDGSGNYITYEYNEADGAAYISKISYTGNSAITPYNTIEFIYSQPDEDVFSNMVYVGGTEIEINKLVDSILVKVEGTRIKSYDLIYTVDEDIRLTEIIEYGSDYSHLNSINILWNQMGTTMTSAFLDLNEPAFSSTGDFNNDGIVDLIYNENYTGWDWFIQLGTTGGISSTVISGSINENSYPCTGLSVCDTDNDGSDEVVFFTSNSSGTRTMYIYDFNGLLLHNKSSQDFTSTEDLNAQAVDFTGDGLNELIVYEDDGDVKYCSNITSYPGNIILGTRDFIFDFNGNGKADIIVADYNNLDISVYEYNNATQTFDYIVQDFEIDDNFSAPIPGDFNGDGKSDILVATDYGERIYYSTGKEFRTYNSGGTLWGSFLLTTDMYAEYDVFLSVQDFNGDGHSDILSLDIDYSYEEPPVYDYKIRLYRFLTYTDEDDSYLDTYFNNDFYFDPESGDTDNMLFGDFNGDGNMDMVYHDSIRYFFPLYKGITVDIIYNSIDDYVKFDYETIARDDDYNTSGVSSPYIPFNHPIQIVKSVTTPDGIGGTNVTNYEYEDGTYHPELGFLGFNVFRTENSLGLQSEIEYENEIHTSSGHKHFSKFPVEQSVVNTNNSTTMSETELTYDHYYSNSGKCFFSNNSNTEAIDYLNDSKVVKSTYINTSTGNIENESIRYYKNTGSVFVKMDSIYRSYTTFGSWHIASRVQTEKAMAKEGSKSIFTVQTNFSWDAYGRLTQTELYPGAAKEVTTNYSQFINTGQPTEISITASGITTREADVTYDNKGRFVLSETNAMNQTSLKTWSAAWGKPLTVTGIDGLTVTYTYDAFGRLSTFENALDNISYYKYRWTTSSDPSTAVYCAVDSIAGSSDAKRYYDIKKRKIREQHQIFGGFSTTDIQYNTYGQLYRVSKPFFTSGSPKWITYEYDTYGRKSTEQEQSLTPKTTFSYDNGEIEITNPAGQVTVKVYDAAGRLVSVTDDLSGSIEYFYNSNGQPDTVETNGAYTLFTYDTYGRKTVMTDPNAGTTSYSYDALGQLVSETDAKSQTRDYEYNAIGKITEMEGLEGTTTYTYSTSGASKGKLTQIAGWDDNTLTFSYDSYCRLSSESLYIDADNKTMTQSYDYDSYGRLDELTYPSGFSVTYHYDSFGNLIYINRGDNNARIWYIQQRTALDQPVWAILGDGMVESYTYDTYDNVSSITLSYNDGGIEMLGASSGLSSSLSLSASSVTLYQTSYVWNATTKNLTSRTNNLESLSESFQYDDLNRLTQSQIGTTTATTSYYTNGNINTKSDAGSYTYSSTKPHAVEEVSSSAGNISTNTQSISYNPFNKVTSVSENNQSALISYAPDLSRCMMEEYTGTTLTKTTYYFKNYEETNTGTIFPYKIHYIYTPDGLVAIMRQRRITKTMYYVAKDHLGSIMALFNADHTKVQENSFDVWGRRRNPSTWTYTSIPTPTITMRGFTGHEHLDDFALINMNGRVYDPVLGRFLSPDPVLQAPENAQNYNKYAYVLNNPLKYTDPSGYMSQHYIVQTNMYAEMARIALQLSAERQEAWGDMKAQIGSGSLLGNMYLGLAIFGSLHSGGSGCGDAPDGGGESEGGNVNHKIPPGWGNPIVFLSGLYIGYQTGSVGGMLAFLNYWCGGGNSIRLTENIYQDVLSNYSSYGGVVDIGLPFYLEGIAVTGKYAAIINSAYLIHNREGSIVGFIDVYDFNLNSKRDVKGQEAVNKVYNASKYNPYDEKYYIYYFDF